LTPGLAALTLASAVSAGSGQDDATLPAPFSPPSPIGFAPSSRPAQAKAEALALTVPTPEKARAWLRILTEEPHPAGSAADHKTALFVRDRLREWGWQAELAEYEVLLNYPKPTGRPGYSSPHLKMLRPALKELSLTEAPHPADKDSASTFAFPAFHGYGVSGDVTGQVVYANYGTPEDFAALDRLGVEVEGKVVLVRYGGIFRGLKVRNAQKRGAKGVLIFSDPADDGYAKGDTYPNGPFRPGSALQRGSVQFLSLGPGDPSTPNGPSVKGAKRLPIDSVDGFTTSTRAYDRNTGVMDENQKVQTHTEKVLSIAEWEKATGLKREDYFATIPSLPISYAAARPILEALGGPNAPTGWQGGLPLPYHLGPGPAEVHFAIDMEYRVRPVWNVIATIKGSAEPDRWVLVGNHRDAWVYGAVDPGSGTAATLEACRAIGAAVKNGWKPRRTLMYASWDAEEYGLVGSTEWADDHAKGLDEKAALLLNVDSAVSGPDLDMDGVPSLRDLLLDAASAVTDVRTGRSLRAVWTEKKRSSWASNAPVDFSDPLWESSPLTGPGSGADAAASAAPPAPVPAPPGSAALAAARPMAKFSPQLNPLGSGSDYTAFLDHLGIPSADVGFAGRYGVYHSIYDDFFWMEKFGDPEFVTHATAARLYAAIAMRAAGADVLPLKFTAYGEALRDHLDDLRRMVERRARAAGPGSNAGAPPMGFDGLDALVKAVKRFQSEAATLDRLTDDLAGRDGVDPARLSKVNDALQRVERAFLLPDGLPGRPWFKHAVFAPGLTTGYASWPLPGVRQAVIDNDSAMLAAQVPALTARIEAAAEALRAASAAARDALPAIPPASAGAGAAERAGPREVPAERRSQGETRARAAEPPPTAPSPGGAGQRGERAK
jgi:N-acetylated-alpha-linked acidic dipeptidase